MRSIYSIEYAEYFVVLCFVMVIMIVHCGFIYWTMSNRVSSQQQMRLQWQYRKGVDWRMSTISTLTKDKNKLILWASYQICIIAGTHAPRMPGTFSPPPRVSYPDMRHCKRVTHVPRCAPASLNNVSFVVGGSENVPGIPGACANRNFSYLVTGPWMC